MSLDKVFAVAQAEFRAMVRSKAFLISVVILPVVVLGMSFAQKQLAARADTSARKFAVVDGSGRFYPLLEAAARERNAHVRDVPEGKPPKPAFEPERALGTPSDDVRLSLSERVRKGELF